MKKSLLYKKVKYWRLMQINSVFRNLPFMNYIIDAKEYPCKVKENETYYLEFTKLDDSTVKGVFLSAKEGNTELYTRAVYLSDV